MGCFTIYVLPHTIDVLERKEKKAWYASCKMQRLCRCVFVSVRLRPHLEGASSFHLFLCLFCVIVGSLVFVSCWTSNLGWYAIFIWLMWCMTHGKKRAITINQLTANTVLSQNALKTEKELLKQRSYAGIMKNLNPFPYYSWLKRRR